MEVEDDDARYRALLANDTRFDGMFFVGISTTGIYCRPVCPARKARRKSCTFFPTAAAAEEAGYRPCLRCRPELAPTTSPYEERFSQAAAILSDIQSGAMNGGRRLSELAGRHSMSVRQLRRVVTQATGATPVQLAQTSRLLLAKQLLTETDLPITEIAFTSGFSSLRRFNELFSASYRMPPTRFRNGVVAGRGEQAVELLLTYRPPMSWPDLLDFLAARAIRGVEEVSGHAYRRTVAIGECHGWVAIEPAAKGDQLIVRVAPALAPTLQPVLAALRHLFDLHARPDLIDGHLAQSPHLAPLVERRPGLRVPGAFEGFELAWRAILGQQVTVKGATTLARRFAERFGRPVDTPHPGVTTLTPTPERVARASVESVAKLGLPLKRAACLIALAEFCCDDASRLAPGSPPGRTYEQLVALPGLGPWTAEYIAMRALHWPDAFPETDLGLQRALRARATSCVRKVAESWRPWRSYAAMHLWMQPKGL
ncbi:MAG: helix-turn-helix domain-containing protein [bacterium]|nr:helix-turn-helix domain-containing protein [bacterium]